MLFLYWFVVMFDWNEFVQSSTRIFNVSRKPSMAEYRNMALVTGVGILLLGLIGFIVKLVLEGFLGI